MDCSPPGFSVYGISQTRILEWVASSSPGDLPNPGIKPTSPALAGGFFTPEPPGKLQGCCYQGVFPWLTWDDLSYAWEFSVSPQIHLLCVHSSHGIASGPHVVWDRLPISLNPLAIVSSSSIPTKLGSWTQFQLSHTSRQFSDTTRVSTQSWH